ncbi:MAG TPA: M24 family metallopeptidase [Chloroflexota bacterium]|nr:M24 family metallopeptidase [Chloroflexota bacterium]
MTRGTERVERIATGLREADLDALICALPSNVLLLSGYWPVVGNALAEDVFEAGMVFNVEPAIYIQGYGDVRHCDVVTVDEHGADVLTPCQADLEHLAIGL